VFTFIFIYLTVFFILVMRTCALMHHTWQEYKYKRVSMPNNASGFSLESFSSFPSSHFLWHISRMLCQAYVRC